MINIQDLLARLNMLATIEGLQDYYQEVLGKKWLLSAEFKVLAGLSDEEKRTYWKTLSDAKSQLESAYKQKEQDLKIVAINKELENDLLDYSLPGFIPETAHLNLVNKTRRYIEDLCKSLWFRIEYGEDIVSKYENFVSVNIPLDHPATEMHDTFYLDQQEISGENLILRTHTSSMQNKYIKQYGVPLKLAIPWKVYRYENMDASHDTVFWQIEWMVIDKDTSIAGFKNIITKILSWVFGTHVEIRMRPWYFPFVEPGFEIDASCPICKWNGCSLCKQTWWIEILWAWMIHPNVLKEAGINPDEYRWFAFGMGLTRITAIKYWIKDIRLFSNGDARFLNSF